jgi:predicted ATPase/DNA-binding XRE family transcriptional regulator
MSTLGPLLRQHREAAGLTQEELADRAGLSSRTVSDVERGLRSRLYPDTAERLAAALQLEKQPRGSFLEAARGRVRATRSPFLVPRPITALFGRERELAELTDAMAPHGRRLLTITGLGGMGKTRLALEAAAQLESPYGGMVRFAAIAPNQQPDLLVGLVATSIGASRGTAPELLATHLSGRPTLVVLDAFEHVLSAAQALEALLVRVPTLHVLVTSRERLHITGEHELALGPLVVPDPADASWRTSGAAALFLDRARDARARLDDDPELVVDICRRLSGLPLALGLAAARARHLPLAALRERLSRGVGDLVEKEHGAQRSLADTLAWTLQSLTPEETTVLDVAVLFPGGCSLDAVQNLCSPDLDAVSAMSGLVDKGLVFLDRSAGGAGEVPRWQMLDVVREFALGSGCRPVDPGQRVAYQQVFLGLLSQVAADVGREQDWYRLLAREEPNVRAALQWAWDDQDAETMLRLGCGMWQYWQAGGALGEGRRWLETGLAIEPRASEQTRMTALWGLAWLAYHQADVEAARAAAIELELLEARHADDAARRNAATVLGMVAIAEDRPDEAVELLDKALDIARRLPAPWILATSLLNLGLGHLSAGDADEARTAIGQALHEYVAIGDERFQARCQGYLGLVSLVEHDLPRARTLFERSLIAFRALGEPAGTAEGLAGLAAVAAVTRHPAHSATITGAAERLRETYAGRELPLDRRITSRYLESAREQLGPKAWHRELLRGWELTLDEAVARALSPPAQP